MDIEDVVIEIGCSMEGTYMYVSDGLHSEIEYDKSKLPSYLLRYLKEIDKIFSIRNEAGTSNLFQVMIDILMRVVTFMTLTGELDWKEKKIICNRYGIHEEDVS